MANPTPALRPPAKLKAIECPSCGSSVELRGFGSALHAVCPSCTSVLDVSHPSIKIIQRHKANTSYREPMIPLGTRGKFDGQPYEAIGFQTRGIEVDGTQYTWDEYVLFNPFYGFRYLTQYDGHWNLVDAVTAVPEESTFAGVKYGNETYKLFQTASAKTLFILGEFPWRAKVGDTVESKDYISPPLVLSAEINQAEVTWSQGRYLTGQEVFAAFQLKEAPPAANGVYSNQPNPHPAPKAMWFLFILYSVVMLMAMLVTAVLAKNEKVFEQRYAFTPGKGEPSFVTPQFELQGGEKNLEMKISTDVTNDWIGFSFALINEQTGTAYDFGTEVSYYSGVDSDGRWSEGDNAKTIAVGSIPGGRYYLRVEPEMEAAKVTPGIFSSPKEVNYTLTLRRDIPVIWPYFAFWPLLLIPPIWASWRRASFEAKRWAESDVAGSFTTSSSSESDDDD